MIQTAEHIDTPLIKSASAGDQQAFTSLFNKYFNIVLLHLAHRFRKVRHDVRQDVAIETIEWWFFNINAVDWKNDQTGYILCTMARNKLSKIIRPKFRVIPFVDVNKGNADSDSEADEDLENRLLDQLVYHSLSGLDYDADLAKMTFQLKRRVDKHIEDLSERDYNVITSFLDGDSVKTFHNKVGKQVNRSDAIKLAFKHLKEAVFDSRNSVFDQQQRMYYKTKVKFKHPDVMKFYYDHQMKIRTIANILNKSYDLIKGWLKRDRDLMINEGKSYYKAQLAQLSTPSKP